jgi:quinol monooxygenase YgiN
MLGSMTVRVAVLITTQPGRSVEQVAAFDLIKAAVRAEEGCIQYDLHRVTNQPDRFLLLEQWESAAALALHDASDLMAEASVRHAAFRSGPVEVLELEPV